VKVAGLISGLTGGCPILAFKVGSTVVATDGKTKFKETNCRDIREGQRVEVKGQQLLSGVVLAETVELKK
jgi:hypothetical protein